MRSMQRVRRSGGAFTLVEVLVVVVIIGIAGAIVVPQMLAAGTMGVQAAARAVIADILYAQNEAIAHQKARKVVFDTASNSYRITDADGATIDASWRTGGGTGYEVNFDRDRRFQGVKLTSASFDGQPELAFDDMGAPSAGGTVTVEYKDLRYRVKVAPFTGRVTVEQF